MQQLKPLIRFDSYPSKIKEVRLELGSPAKYQTIEVVEKIIAVDESTKKTIDEPKREYEILFRVVDNSTETVTSHSMSREDLNDYISMLRDILVQTK